MATNWKQLKAIETKNKKRILEICPSANNESGIYVFLRYEGEFKYAYIGQAKHLLTRLAQHLNGYQHIDLSIKRHGLYSEENPTGWQVVCANYPEDALDDTERQLIAAYANKGYQLRNKTAGGQDSGKFGIDDNRPAKGYYDGLQQGYERQMLRDTAEPKPLLYGKYSRRLRLHIPARATASIPLERFSRAES